MRGFLQKDIELLKQNRSFLGLVIVMVIFFVCIRNDAFVIIYLGMMGGFLSISTISYDEADRGMGFLMTLPATRKTYAIEKYILGYGVSFLLLLTGFVVSAIGYGAGRMDADLRDRNPDRSFDPDFADTGSIEVWCG